jgi:glycosyltransferase involved in cell wall biosynthesis
MEKVTLIFTVRNEENNVQKLLSSIENQVKPPNQIVVVDGGSTDTTLLLLKKWKPSFPVLVLQKAGNRSVGRNLAIAKSIHPLIAITDAGCVLDKQWLLEITKPFTQSSCDCVAGYYRADCETWLQEAVAPYMLVMPTKVNPHNFLPATRSMAIRKSVWEKTGKFSESYSHNEDYHFAKKLQSEGAKIVFAPKAIVGWSPPKKLSAFYWQILRFSFGDAESGILRPKVVLLFLRYLLFLGFLMKDLNLFLLMLFLYSIWSMYKQRGNIHSLPALFMQPILQIGTDMIIMFSTLFGTLANMLRNDNASNT